MIFQRILAFTISNLRLHGYRCRANHCRAREKNTCLWIRNAVVQQNKCWIEMWMLLYRLSRSNLRRWMRGGNSHTQYRVHTFAATALVVTRPSPCLLLANGKSSSSNSSSVAYAHHDRHIHMLHACRTAHIPSHGFTHHVYVEKSSEETIFNSMLRRVDACAMEWPCLSAFVRL